jgi:predicted nucleic acid-binding protein
MLLLDTDAVSHLTRGTLRPGLQEAVLAVPEEELFISAITVAELLYGLEKHGGRENARRRLELEVFSRLPILPFDEDAARIYASLRADLECAGTPLDESDLQIAAIALSRGLRLLTGNGRHFRRVPGLELAEF